MKPEELKFLISLLKSITIDREDVKITGVSLESYQSVLSPKINSLVEKLNDQLLAI